MPKLVRRAPLSERLKNYLNPLDFLLWLSEELNDLDWDEYKEWSVPAGLAVNLIFLIARANTSAQREQLDDDIFGDYEGKYGSGWFKWLVSDDAICLHYCRFQSLMCFIYSIQCSSIVYTLSAFSFANAFYTFYRKRHYRLFENSIDVVPSTPSARRVRVDSSPLSSSPLRFFSDMMASTSAVSRAHPDGTQHVWEVSVWDPTPVCLRSFCLFSPGHVLVYWSFLPTSSSDPRPSVTAVTALLLCALLSAQLSMLQTSFSRQVKDTALVHKEVLNEYDAKYVHPSLTQVVREVGTQTQSEKFFSDEVDMSNPFYLINRGFKTHPNPAYSSHYDPVDHLQKRQLMQQRHKYESRANSTPNFIRPTYESENTAPVRSNHFASSSATSGTELSSPLRPTQSRPSTAYRQAQPNFAGDGGSLGVYQHAASPIRKAASLNVLRPEDADSVSRRREGSPLKKVSTPGGVLSQRFERLRGYGGRRDSGRI